MASLRRNNSEIQEKASFKKISDNLRRLTPLEIQCHVFCGGKKCKYEGANAWTKEQMAIDGVFSHWVTCNILAMARPNMDVIENFDLIGQFKRKGIRTLINLQQPGEHAHCGKSLDPSGFSYSPDAFMKEGIFFYNFGWKDYQVGHLDAITDIVKVMAFSLQEGKIAVHCHAGLGRTGVLIACFLIYWCRISANQAIHYVRLKRPNSIQSEAQVECVRQFAQHILPNFIVFSKGGFGDFTLLEFLHRQETVLHGEDARTFKYLPKVIFQLCERLLQLSGRDPVASVDTDNNDNTGARRRAFWHRFLSLQPGWSPATTPTPIDKEGCNFFPQERLIAGGPNIDETINLKTDNPSEKDKETQLCQQIDQGRFVYDEGSSSNVVTRKGNVITNNASPKEVKNDNSSTPSISEEKSYVDNTVIGREHELKENCNTASKVQTSTVSSTAADSNNSTKPSVNAPTIVLPKYTPDSDDEVSVSPTAFLANRRRSVSTNDLTDFMGNNVSPLLLEEPPGSPYMMIRPSSQAVEGANDTALLVAEEVPAMKLEELFYQTKPHAAKHTLDTKDGKGTCTAEEVAVALSVMDDVNSASIQIQNAVAELQAGIDLTSDGMSIIPDTNDIHVLARLLHVWLQQLKQPVLSKQEVTRLAPCSDDPVGALHKLDKGTRVTVEYILRFVAHLNPLDVDRHDILLVALLRSLTHLPQLARIDVKTFKNQALTPHGGCNTPSKIGHLETALNFSQKLLPLLTNHFPPP